MRLPRHILMAWPKARLRTARKDHFCDWPWCFNVIQAGDQYIDPGDNRRFCLDHMALPEAKHDHS
jgi:hypothetical protein